MGSGLIITSIKSTVDSGELILPPIRLAVQHIFFPSPEHKMSSLYFIFVFHWTLWMGIGGIVLIALTMLLFNNFYQQRFFSEYIEIVYDIFGFHSASQNISSSMQFFKIIISVWIFLMSTVFSSFLIAQMTIFENNLPFNNLEELLNQNKYSLCMSRYSIANEIVSPYQKANAFKNEAVNGQNCKILDFTKFTTQMSDLVCKRSDLAFLIEPQDFHAYIEAFG